MSFYNLPMDKIKSQPIDMGAIMRQVYLWVAVGLAVCFGLAYTLGMNAIITDRVDGQFVQMINPNAIIANPAVYIVAFIAYLALAFTIHPIIMRSSLAIGSATYILFTAVFGVMLAGIFVTYTQANIAAAFVTTSAMFAAMSVVGYTTKVDLSRFGYMFMMALIGLAIATIVNLFLRSSMLDTIISYAGVLIFVGLIAYDTQWIKNQAEEISRTGDQLMIGRIALLGAVHLFTDFINLFLFILRLMGSNRD